MTASGNPKSGLYVTGSELDFQQVTNYRLPLQDQGVERRKKPLLLDGERVI